MIFAKLGNNMTKTAAFHPTFGISFTIEKISSIVIAPSTGQVSLGKYIVHHKTKRRLVRYISYLQIVRPVYISFPNRSRSILIAKIRLFCILSYISRVVKCF